eukprot:3566580-Rhodomonas_salina.3
MCVCLLKLASAAGRGEGPRRPACYALLCQQAREISKGALTSLPFPAATALLLAADGEEDGKEKG